MTALDPIEHWDNFLEDWGGSLAGLRASLLTWYSQAKRDLPWRENHDPYRIWVSEIMLQQTRVETVIPYFHRFLERFPTVQALADAPLDDVLAQWSGLGYYRRARHLHKAAQEIRDRHEGNFPSTLEEVLALSGIGRYTAGAILSIAFGQEVPLVDGNVFRILSRLFHLTSPLHSTPLTKQSWKIAEALVTGEEPGDFNQSLMELGALICAPSRPTCLFCPVREHCKAHELGVQETLPTPKVKKTKVKDVGLSWAFVRKDGQWLMQKRPAEGLFAGMWDFPGVVAGRGKKPPAFKSLKKLLKEWGAEIQWQDSPHSFEHLLSHRRLHIHVYVGEWEGGELSLDSPWQWVGSEEMQALGCSSIVRKIANTLDNL